MRHNIAVQIVFLFFLLFPLVGNALNCPDYEQPFEKRLAFADNIFTAKIVKDEALPPPAKGMNRKLTVRVEKTYKGWTWSGREIDLYYIKPKGQYDECIPEVFSARLEDLIDGKSEFLFYTKNVEGKRFLSQGLGFYFVEFGKTKNELKELSKLEFSLKKFFSLSWIQSLF